MGKLREQGTVEWTMTTEHFHGRKFRRVAVAKGGELQRRGLDVSTL